MKHRRYDAEQMEFDLVAPGLAGHDANEERLLDEAAVLLKEGKTKVTLARIAAELHREESIICPTPSNELAELRVLIGPTAWKKDSAAWKRRLNQNLRAFRKVLIVLRNTVNR